MALLKIARMGHPVLLARAERVADPDDPTVRQLIDDMIETMHDARGAGLAAPQVHVGRRVFVYRVPDERSTGPDDPPLAVQALINPQITPIGDGMVLRLEGCLSIPGLRAAVPRHARVRYEGIDCEGRAVEGEAVGFLSMVLQHENDHLDGILYPMRMTDMSRFGFEDELARHGMPS
jgi:peptide deformylase